MSCKSVAENERVERRCIIFYYFEFRGLHKCFKVESSTLRCYKDKNSQTVNSIRLIEVQIMISMIDVN